MSEEQRIPALAPEDWPEELQPLLEGRLAGRATLGSLNIFRTFANFPKLMRTWLPFGGFLLGGGRLSPYDREILILRTGWNAGSPYEWGQHVRIGLEAGLSQEQIDAIAAGASAEVWNDHERALLTAADELHADSTITDATWAALESSYDTEQLMELPILVGHYHMVAYALNSFKVQLDDGLVPMPPA
jgi:alkylhydroperoxidase family enzyme